MIALDDYEKLKRQVEALEKERERSVGVLNELLKDMQQKHGCKTLKELKRKLEVMKEKEQAVAKEYFSAKKKFTKKWEHVLDPETYDDPAIIKENKKAVARWRRKQKRRGE